MKSNNSTKSPTKSAVKIHMSKRYDSEGFVSDGASSNLSGDEFSKKSGNYLKKRKKPTGIANKSLIKEIRANDLAQKTRKRSADKLADGLFAEHKLSKMSGKVTKIDDKSLNQIFGLN